MHRMAIAFFSDRQGRVDEYFTFLLSSLRPFVARTLFVSDGPLEKCSEKSVASLVEELLIARSEGVDIWTYKAAIEHIGYQAILDYDEVLLLDHTFFGPIFPFGEMFAEMGTRLCDLWGITARKRPGANPSPRSGNVAVQLNSSFVAIRKSVLEFTSLPLLLGLYSAHSKLFRCGRRGRIYEVFHGSRVHRQHVRRPGTIRIA